MKQILTLITTFLSVIVSAQPLLRVGVMSDTHVTNDIQSCEILRDTLELFKKHKVELIINAGDIADVYDAGAYENYRNTFNAVYPEPSQRPPEIFAYAYHDIIGHPSNSPWEAFKDVKKYLKATNDPYDLVKHKGFVFIVLPQYHQPDKYKKLLDAAEKERNGKPFFIVDHVPLHNTLVNTLNGNTAARALVDRHPDAVHISGHIHSLLTNELNIWQGNFTAINAGFLHGSMRVKKSCDVAGIMDIYRDKIVFKRYFTDTQNEYASSSRWSFPLPFDKKTAPYSAENRLKKSTAPAFASDASIKITPTEKSVEIKFPQVVTPAKDILRYNIELARKENGEWKNFAHAQVVGNYEYGENETPLHCSKSFSYGYFDIGFEYQFKVTPIHFSGEEGMPLTANFTLQSKPGAEIIFESANPMKECVARYGFLGATDANLHKITPDGFYQINEENIGTRVYLHDYTWSNIGNARFIFDIDIEQAPDRRSRIEMRNSAEAGRAVIPQRFYTPKGSSKNIRCVIDYSLRDFNGAKLHFFIKDGGKFKFKINYARIERY